MRDAPNPFEADSDRSESSEFLETDKVSSHNQFMRNDNLICVEEFDYDEIFVQKTMKNKPLKTIRKEIITNKESGGLSVRSQAIKASGIF